MNAMFRVAAVTNVCFAVKSLRLVRADRKAVEPFAPGAHVCITISDPASGLRGTRAYTLTSDPADRGAYEITVASNERTASISRLLYEQVRPGRVLTVSAPVQGFRIPEGNFPVVLIAGGIGITPIYAMARELSQGAREFEVYYCGKSIDRMPFVDEMRKFAGERLHLRTTASPACGRFNIASILSNAPPLAQACVCGPDEMIRATRSAADALGWPASRVHAESFTGTTSWDERPFKLHLARSNRMVDVQAGQSVLDALIQSGLHVEYDCRHGSCGRCTQRVLAGEPDHQDGMYSGSSEVGWIRVCVSRSRSAVLSLDL